MHAYRNALLAVAIVNLVAVGLGATPGKLIAPGVVQIQLKDGEPYNITCPPLFSKNVGNFFAPGDYKDMAASCVGADFDTNEGCDACLTAFVSAAFNKPRFSGTDDERQSQGTFRGNIPFAILPQINFSNGCPFAQACKSELVQIIDDNTKDTKDDALGKAFEDMIDKCKGSNPGPDYQNAFKEVQKILQATNRTSSPAPAPDAGDTPAPEASGAPFPVTASIAALTTAVIAMVI